MQYIIPSIAGFLTAILIAIMAVRRDWSSTIRNFLFANQSLTVMNSGLAIVTHGGTTKARFEAYSLSASIVGKCHFCVNAHYDTLKKEGYTVEQLKDIGRIAAVMTAVSKVMAA